MASAAEDFATLDPANLPSIPTSIDIWILRGQQIILSQKFQSDEAFNWQFPGFIDHIKTTFGQTISAQKQDYNQALILQEKQFKFVRLDSNDTFACKKTKKLAQLVALFEQIVSQEQSFLDQLNSFTNMLHEAEIFTTTTSAHVVAQTQISSRPKRSIAEVAKPFPNSNVTLM